MRIAIVSSTQEIVGGAEVYVRWVLRDFLEQAHTVGFAFEYATKNEARAADRDLEGVSRWCIADLGRERFLEEMREFAPDLVYLNYTHDPHIELELCRTFPCVLFAHSYYGTCATGTRMHRRLVPQVCTRSFSKACLLVNYTRDCGIRRPDDLIRNYLGQSVRLRTLAAVRAVIVASRHVRDVFEAQGITRDKIHVIPYPVIGVSRQEQPTARAFTRRVLFTGRLTALKGVRDAVVSVAEASRILQRELLLQVAGEGPEAEPARLLSRRLGGRTQFLGWQNESEREELLAQADVLIVPSRWPEPFGMVGVEAACFGVPSVAYPVGGIPDWLRDGVSGELARGQAPLNQSALTDALVRALASPEHHQALREGAWRTSAEYSPDVHRARLKALLRQTVPAARGCT
jgi:glycosyltransferase involved in cell wall biosynthesis